MSWFKRQEAKQRHGADATVRWSSGEKRVRTEGLWIKCDGAAQTIWKADLEANLNVCPQVRPALQDWRAAADRAAARAGLRAGRRGAAIDRSAELYRHEALQGAAGEGAARRPG